MELVTGKGATDHVSSADMASLYRGLLIADDAVLDTGDKLACTMLDANTAEIGTGDCMLQAHHARVEVAEQLTVRSGSQGFNRNDLIVARYTLGDNNVQAVYLAVIEGTAVAGAASDPAYAEGDIDGGDTLVEFPIWRIPISGVNVGTPERIMPTVDTLQSQIASVQESVNKIGLLDGSIVKIGPLRIKNYENPKQRFTANSRSEVTFNISDMGISTCLYAIVYLRTDNDNYTHTGSLSFWNVSQSSTSVTAWAVNSSSTYADMFPNVLVIGIV